MRKLMQMANLYGCVLMCQVILFGCGQSKESDSDLDVIYGDDNRQDVYLSDSTLMKQRASSTVALVQKNQVSINQAAGTISLPAASYGSSQGLCSTERFYEQPNPAFCSGFLVAPDIMVTAGHCITNQASCDSTAFVFGMGYYSSASDNPVKLPVSEMYSCSQVIRTQNPGDGADFAVVKLDRPVVGHAPVILRSSGSPAIGDSLTVIGHPSGLPTKIAGDGLVRSVSGNGYLVASTDTYGGNSGSAVFNSTSGILEGILVRGEQDFELRGSCYVSKVCTQSGCRGEDITLANAFASLIPSPTPIPDPLPDPNNQPEVRIYEQASLHVNVPDNNSTGILQNVQVNQIGKIISAELSIKIKHTYIGDLVVSLRHSDGTVITLHNRAGGSKDDINAVYSGSVLNSLVGKLASGAWAVKITDRARIDVGYLSYVKLTVSSKL